MFKVCGGEVRFQTGEFELGMKFSLEGFSILCCVHKLHYTVRFA
jgi:hypothetical protein